MDIHYIIGTLALSTTIGALAYTLGHRAGTRPRIPLAGRHWYATRRNPCGSGPQPGQRCYCAHCDQCLTCRTESGRAA